MDYVKVININIINKELKFMTIYNNNESFSF